MVQSDLLSCRCEFSSIKNKVLNLTFGSRRLSAVSVQWLEVTVDTMERFSRFYDILKECLETLLDSSISSKTEERKLTVLRLENRKIIHLTA